MASELAGKTAKARTEISEQIASIRTANDETVVAIDASIALLTAAPSSSVPGRVLLTWFILLRVPSVCLPSSSLRLAEVTLNTGQHHLILVADIEGEPFFLDNLGPEVLSLALTKSGYYCNRIHR